MENERILTGPKEAYQWGKLERIERLWRNVKYERVYLHDYETVKEAVRDIGDYFDFYNNERPHQSLEYQTPAEVYYNGYFERKVLS